MLWTEFEIAHGTFSKSNGIVVDIHNNKKGQMVFEAVLWSDYHEESEYFFIGGLKTFQFLTIHDVTNQRDYKSFIAPMSMLKRLIWGYPYKMRPITKFDAKILDRMITDNLSDSVSTKIPLYIQRLFANFTNNVQRVEINMDIMNRAQDGNAYGYLSLNHLFFAGPLDRLNSQEK